MRVEITEHQLHHEQLRYLQSKDGFWSYHKRFLRITRTEKLAAVAVFSLYRSEIGVNAFEFNQLAKIVAKMLQDRGVTEIQVWPSKHHQCIDKAYRIDEWAATTHRFRLVTDPEFVKSR